MGESGFPPNLLFFPSNEPAAGRAEQEAAVAQDVLSDDVDGRLEVFLVPDERGGFEDEAGEGGEGAHEADQQDEAGLRREQGAFVGQRPDDAEQGAAQEIDGHGAERELAAEEVVDRAGQIISGERSGHAGQGEQKDFLHERSASRDASAL